MTEVGGIMSMVYRTGNGKGNRGSFDYDSHDGAVSGFAQDDSSWVRERKGKSRATAKTKCGGLSTTAQKNAASVEMTEVDGGYERGYRTGNGKSNRRSFGCASRDTAARSSASG